MIVGEFQLILSQLRDLYLAAGAKGAAKDLRNFSEVLKPHAAKTITAFCAEARDRLARVSQNPKARKKGMAASGTISLNQSAIRNYVERLRAAGTDREAFETVFAELKADKLLNAPDVVQIARQYADTVTKYKSIRSAHTDISKAFVRQARFENKLR